MLTSMQWIPEQEQLPHVFTAQSNVLGLAMSQGGKFALPSGTEREMNDVSVSCPASDFCGPNVLTGWGQTYEEVIIPPSRPIPPRATEKPVRIADLAPLAKGCFPVSSLDARQRTEGH